MHNIPVQDKALTRAVGQVAPIDILADDPVQYQADFRKIVLVE